MTDYEEPAAVEQPIGRCTSCGAQLYPGQRRWTHNGGRFADDRLYCEECVRVVPAPAPRGHGGLAPRARRVTAP
jgi:hypothetical protein